MVTALAGVLPGSTNLVQAGVTLVGINFGRDQKDGGSQPTRQVWAIQSVLIFGSFKWEINFLKLLDRQTDRYDDPRALR